MATQVPPQKPGATPSKTQDVWDVELLHVHVSRKGQLVNAEWAIHPQIKADLSADEWKELGELMGKVTTIVGHRFFLRISARLTRLPKETHSMTSA